MEAKKALLLGALLCHLSVLVHGATYNVFASMKPNASDTFPQVHIFLNSPNNVNYLYMQISSTSGGGMECYLAEANVTGQSAQLIQKWGGVPMLGDYSASDVCSLVLDDGGYIAVKTDGYYLNIYNLTAYQAAHIADVKIYLKNDGTVWISANGTTTPSASSPPPPASSPPSSPPPTASYPPPPSTTSPSASSPPPPPASKTTSPPPPTSRTGLVQNSAAPLSKFYLPSVLFTLLLLCKIAF